MGASGDEWGVSEAPMLGFGRERRLNAQAYARWTALARGRAMPALTDLAPDDLTPFADHAALIDLSGPTDAGARIAYLGRALRDEGGIAPAFPTATDIPDGSMLATLLARLPALRAAAAPIGCEGDVADHDGRAHYRGILLPFAGDDGTLAAVLGVIRWQRLAVAIDPDIAAAVAHARALRPARAAATWPDARDAAADANAADIAARFAVARTWAVLAGRDRVHGAAPLHAAVGATHDLTIAARAAPDAFAALAARCGVAPPAGDADTALPEIVVDLVFDTADAARREDFAAALRAADRLGIGVGRLADLLDRHAGGLAGFVAATRIDVPVTLCPLPDRTAPLSLADVILPPHMRAQDPSSGRRDAA